MKNLLKRFSFRVPFLRNLVAIASTHSIHAGFRYCCLRSFQRHQPITFPEFILGDEKSAKRIAYHNNNILGLALNRLPMIIGEKVRLQIYMSLQKI